MIVTKALYTKYHIIMHYDSHDMTYSYNYRTFVHGRIPGKLEFVTLEHRKEIDRKAKPLKTEHTQLKIHNKKL